MILPAGEIQTHPGYLDCRQGPGLWLLLPGPLLYLIWVSLLLPNTNWRWKPLPGARFWHSKEIIECGMPLATARGLIPLAIPSWKMFHASGIFRHSYWCGRDACLDSYYKSIA